MELPSWNLGSKIIKLILKFLEDKIISEYGLRHSLVTHKPLFTGMWKTNSNHCHFMQIIR